ncbi:MAG: hypothetical protein JW839_23175 [Candidatus Lokiarchaeota archaeon]|nr:hypothetical protein [Candidatus Lokiarchaeota archaeon]
MSTRTSERGEPAGKATFYKSFQAIMLVAAIGIAGLIVYTTIDNVTRPIWSTSHYHFNVQYRAGNDTAMTEVVNNSLIPTLQMYARHPNWKANIEFQALMLEWMDGMGNTTRLTDVYDPDTGTTLQDLNGMNLLRYLVHRNQIQLVVIQYSDALAIAYPYIDFYKSVNHTRGMLRDMGIINDTDADAVSRAVLLQEGQFMLGASRQARDFRFPGSDGRAIYDTFLTTRESLSYFGVKQVAPIYTAETGGEQIYVLPYNPVPSIEGGVLHHILWFQDGENMNAGEGETWSDVGFVNNTDEAEHFPFDEAKQLNHERRLEDLEAMGNVFVTLDEWVQYLLDRGEARPLDRWVPETHWAVLRYRSSFIWMGETKTSQVYEGAVEYDDSEINARNYRTHQILLATETLLNHSRWVAGSIDQSQYAALYANLTRAWLDLAEAQVTDSTGLTPRTYEGVAAVYKTGRAMQVAKAIQEVVVNATPGLYDQIFGLNESIQLLPSNIGTGNPLYVNGSAINFTTVGLASISNLRSVGVDLDLMNNGTVSFSTVRLETPWNMTGTNQTVNGTIAYSVRVLFPRTNTSAYADKDPWSYARFKGDFSSIEYTPSMWERENVSIALNRSDYNVDKVDYYEDWDNELLDNFEIYLALSNGLIYSRNGGFAIIKNCSSTHVCAKWNTNDVRFMQTKTLSAMDPAGETWQFFVVPSVTVRQAIEIANLVNTDAPLSLSGGDFA